MSEAHPKRAFLSAVGALHPHPDRVRAELFLRHRFFDPLDKVQVKYEMLRAHAIDGDAVMAAAEAFGFSRQTFYTTLDAFEEFGILGLAEEKRGRRGPLKLAADDLKWLEALAHRAPELSGRQIAQRLWAERGVSVHRRTIERVLARSGKKNG
jgi:transposase